MTMQDITSFGRQQTPAPAFWHDYEAFPFASFRRGFDRMFDNLFRKPAYDLSGYAPFSTVFAILARCQIQLKAAAMMPAAPVAAHSPWAIRSRSGFQSSTV